MRLPNWFWPKASNPQSGLAVRLGRLLHWLCAIAAAVLTIFASALAMTALLSSPANAQRTDASLAQENAVDPADVVWDEPAERAEPTVSASDAPKLPRLHSPERRPETGTLADAVEPMPDLRPVEPTRAPIEESRQTTVDWDLLQQAGALLIAAFLLALTGRGLRYVLSDE
jgi:hypothetical protein